MKSCGNFFAMNAHDPSHWTLNSCFGAFHSVWVHLGSFRNCMKLGAKRGERCNYCISSCHEVTSGVFTMNAPNPPHWSLNSYFGALHSVWVHLGFFHNCIKLDEKQGELVQLIQKFVPQSHIGIFRNERTQSTPLDPELMFWCIHSVWVHLR